MLVNALKSNVIINIKLHLHLLSRPKARVNLWWAYARKRLNRSIDRIKWPFKAVIPVSNTSYTHIPKVLFLGDGWAWDWLFVFFSLFILPTSSSWVSHIWMIFHVGVEHTSFPKSFITQRLLIDIWSFSSLDKNKINTRW